MKNIADNLGQAAVSGNLSRSIGFNVSSMGIVAPPPPASDPAWNEVTAARAFPFKKRLRANLFLASL